MAYERAARLNDPVGKAYATEGAIAGAAIGEFLAMVITPPPWKALTLLRALLPIRRLWGTFPIWAYQGGRLRPGIRPWVATTAYRLNSRVTKAMRERLRTLPGSRVAAAATALGSQLGSQIVVVNGLVAEGSLNVYTNERPAARVDDAVTCHGSQIKTGSDIITINLRPAARVADETKCGDVIADGSPNVMMGGAKVTSARTPSRLANRLARNVGHAAGVPTRDGRISRPSTWLRWFFRDLQRGVTKTMRDEARDQARDLARGGGGS